MITIKDSYRSLFPETSVSAFCAIRGKVFKRIQNRCTQRIERNGRAFFIKCHDGIGWAEVFKNLLTLRLPVFDAGNEWRAILRLRELGLDTMQAVAWGGEGFAAQRRSFLITESLEQATDLESWFIKQQSDPATRRILARRIGSITATLHDNGVNHRDYYLCHLRIDQTRDPSPASAPIYIMDLHRAQIRKTTPSRWAIKDLAGMLHSSLHGPARLALTRQDIASFLRGYLGPSWRQRLRANRPFWQQVILRYKKTCQHDGQDPVPLFVD